MDIKKTALEKHQNWNGKISTGVKSKIKTAQDLSIAYTPGVAEPCKAISQNPALVYDYTIKSNTIAVITDGSAVLGLGNIGAEASIPVMEGKAVLFKEFADINAFPICLNTQDPEAIIETVKRIAPVFGGINLEDISAPRCFYIEKRLKEELDIPVFHDDQHGTAVVVLAAIINSLKQVKKKPSDLKIVVNGAGAAGTAIAKLLLEYGCQQIILCDKNGALSNENGWINEEQHKIAQMTNPDNLEGPLDRILVGADIFIGVSAPGIVTEKMIHTMNVDPIVFAMANPVPEIMPGPAKKAGARIIGTGRSDFPNQVNNVLAFPGILKAALTMRKQITDRMKIAASQAIADFLPPDVINDEKILPYPFEAGISDHVAKSIISTMEDETNA